MQQQRRTIKKINPQPSDKQALRAIPEPAPGTEVLPANLRAPGYADMWLDSIVSLNRSAVRSVVITGVESGSGATTSAAHLAMTLAKDADRKVLLMEANLRSPVVHELFRLNGGVSLSSLISRGSGAEFVVPMMHEDLYILPGGGRADTPGVLLRTQAFLRLYSLALSNFDTIVVDAPPITHCPETRYLASLVDGVVLVVEAEKTRKEVVQFAAKQIENAGGQLIGTVLNKTKQHIPDWLYERI